MHKLTLILVLLIAGCTSNTQHRVGPMGCANPLQTASPTSGC
jgi:hypothetical protein